jgi:hypothetical protein
MRDPGATAPWRRLRLPHSRSATGGWHRHGGLLSAVTSISTIQYLSTAWILAFNPKLIGWSGPFTSVFPPPRTAASHPSWIGSRPRSAGINILFPDRTAVERSITVPSGRGVPGGGHAAVSTARSPRRRRSGPPCATPLSESLPLRRFPLGATRRPGSTAWPSRLRSGSRHPGRPRGSGKSDRLIVDGNDGVAGRDDIEQ